MFYNRRKRKPHQLILLHTPQMYIIEAKKLSQCQKYGHDTEFSTHKKPKTTFCFTFDKVNNDKYSVSVLWIAHLRNFIILGNCLGCNKILCWLNSCRVRGKQYQPHFGSIMCTLSLTGRETNQKMRICCVVIV